MDGARVAEAGGVEERQAAMQEVVQRAWSAAPRDLEYRRSTILSTDASAMAAS